MGFVPLCRLLTADRPSDRPMAIDAGRDVAWTTFSVHVARLATIVSARGAGRWLIFTDSAYAFAVSLMAVWQARAVAVLAPNGQPGTLAELGEGAHGLITDADRVARGCDTITAIHETGAATRRPAVLDRDAIAVELFTSGSTGTKRAVSKTVANLEDEVAGLERQWGALLGGRLVLGTVSHQHIYGLLFRVLWPLAAGRVFHAQSLLHPEAIAVTVERAGACCLVGSPAHLSRLKGFRGITRMTPSCRPIFSSGGPLDTSTAAALRETFGAAPFEVFGSTETGGVAWRRQDAGVERPAWTPFPGVAVQTDGSTGLLRVRSPFVSHETGAVTIGDRVEMLADGRFLLGPRTDRIVKLGDKRLSLPEMERALAEHVFVSQAAVVVIPHRMGARLGAAVVLTPGGREALAREGRRGVSQALVQCLQPYWDPILLPRAWRYVTRLPEDTQGKVTLAALNALFTSPYDPAIVDPEILDETTVGTIWERRLRVPETLGYLDGHFPGLAVVPGVVQIQWVVDLARTALGRDVTLVRMEALKFKEVLRPGDVVHLRAELGPADRLDFRMWNSRAVFSSGRCTLGAADCGGP